MPEGIEATPSVTAGFEMSAVLGLPPLDVVFTNTSTAVLVEIGEYLWDFGDGTTSTEQNPPQHTYSLPGEYTVSLKVTSGELVDTMTKTRCVYVVGQNVMLPSDVLIETRTETVALGTQELVKVYRSKNEYGKEMIKEVREAIPAPETTPTGPSIEERVSAIEAAVLTLTGV